MGSTSMPSETARPEWVNSVLAAVDDLPEVRVNRRPNATAVSTDFLPGAYGAIVKAAGARRLSVASYVRRAALALAAHDLGIPLSDLLERDPRMSRQGGFPVDDPDGSRFGPWVITELTGGES